MLQDDLNTFLDWCTRNELSLNVFKYSKISFFRNKNQIPFVYFIGNNRLPYRELVIIPNLDITFQSNLLFSTSVEEICQRAIKAYQELIQ